MNAFSTTVLAAALFAAACTSDDGPTPLGPSGESKVGLVINEFLASNDNVNTDPDIGDFGDWIEIYNTSSATIDMGGMYLTDDLSEPTKWQFPAATTLVSGGFLLVWCDDEDTAGEALHTNFKLSSGGEAVGLYDIDGATAIDTLTYGEQTTDISYGRTTNGGEAWTTFATPTPGAPNN